MHTSSTNYKQLQPEDRMTIASLRQQNFRIRRIAIVLQRSPEVEDWQFLGHWEGDLIKGEGNASAAGTLVERTSRLLMLVKLSHPKPASAVNVLQAFTEKLYAIAQPMRKTLTYEKGKGMALHKPLTANTGMAVYFCDPHSP